MSTGGVGDLYAELDVPRTATKDQIRQQYKKLALKYHPDRVAGGSEQEKRRAAEKFKAVSRAYEILSDDRARRQYDEAVDSSVDDPPFSHHQYQQRTPSSRSPSSGFGAGGGGVGGGKRGMFGGFPDPFEDPFFARGMGMGSSLHRSSPFSSMLDDMMSLGVGFGGPMMGQRRSHASPFFPTFGSSLFQDFQFRDPFELFDQMFGEGLMAATAADGRRQGGGGTSMMSFSSFSSGGFLGGVGGGRMQSVSTVTEIRNGQRVTRTVRRTQDEHGVVHEDEDEEVEHLHALPACTPNRRQPQPQLLPQSTASRRMHPSPVEVSAARQQLQAPPPPSRVAYGGGVGLGYDSAQFLPPRGAPKDFSALRTSATMW